MTQKVVVVGIQSRQQYMTVNNRLVQAVGASKLMDKAVRDFPEHCDGAERIYVGGGNAAVRFSGDSVDEAIRNALGSWSRKWIAEAPEIRLAAGSAEGDDIAAWKKARKKMALYEERGSFGCELGFLPVTDRCPDTGRAAQTYDKVSDQWLSQEAHAKNKAGKEYNQRLNSGEEDGDIFEQVLDHGNFWFPKDLDELGILFGARHIAVVHCDGNGVGKALEDCTTFEELKKKSALLTDGSRKALLSTFKSVRLRYPDLVRARVIREALYQQAVPYFPARMLVQAGDDANWVCHGRLGLASAVRYCLHYQEHVGLTACAGVAIVPVGFPYRRAYELAEELCAKAKDKRKKDGNAGDCCIDFHLVTEGSPRSVEQSRSTEYRPGLPKRPFLFSLANLNEWENFEEKARFFTSGIWAGARSRSKRLLEEISVSGVRGKECADLFETQRYTLPNGWAANASSIEQCFDALELLDFHVDWPLDPAEFETENEHANA